MNFMMGSNLAAATGMPPLTGGGGTYQFDTIDMDRMGEQIDDLVLPAFDITTTDNGMD